MAKNIKPKGVPKPPRKILFISGITHALFKKSANDADRKYDPHLMRMITFYEKYKGVHPQDS